MAPDVRVSRKRGGGYIDIDISEYGYIYILDWRTRCANRP